MTKQLIRPMVAFTFIYCLLAALHGLLASQTFTISIWSPVVLKAYVLFWIYSNLLIFLSISLLKKEPVRGGWAFLAGTVFKMFLALFYLIPIIKLREADMRAIVLQVIIAYFISLALEVWVMYRALNKVQ